METTRLIDPGFWHARGPVFPGVAPPRWADQAGSAVWFQTSGSTGQARWIGHSREGLLVSAAAVNRHLGVQASDVWGLALPLRHVGGFGVVARAYEAGCRLEVWDQAWAPGPWVEWLAARRVGHITLVPTQLHDLVRAELAAPACLRTLVVGGGRLPRGLCQAARRLGWPVLPSYGLTEAGSQVATADPGRPDLGDDGETLPILLHWDVRIGDDDGIAIRGPALFIREARPGADGVTVIERVGEWHSTRDRGRLQDGRLAILGRADAIVKILGELVDPVAVEARLGLVDAVVVAVPEPRRGHQLLLAVEGPVTESHRRALTTHNARAPGPQRLAGAVSLDTLPRGALGKWRRADLTQDLTRRHAESPESIEWIEMG